MGSSVFSPDGKTEERRDKRALLKADSFIFELSRYFIDILAIELSLYNFRKLNIGNHLLLPMLVRSIDAIFIFRFPLALVS